MKKYLLGIDLGGTYIKTHIFTTDGKSIGNVKVKTPSNNVDLTINAIIDSIKNVANKFISDSNLKKILNVGVGIPGTIDSTCKKIIFAPNLKWENIDFVSKLEKKLNIPVKIENDANLAAIGEYWQGNAKNIKNFISITIGTGIGGGIFINGKLLTGVNHNASEIGHMIIHRNGLKCNCGNYGCWEKYGSTSSLVERVKIELKKDIENKSVKTNSTLFSLAKNDLEQIEGKHIVDAAKNGDELSKLQIDFMQYNLAIGISNLIFLFNPELILLNGGIMNQGEWFASPIRNYIEKLVPKTSLKNLKIKPGKLGNMAGAYGAAYLGMDGRLTK
jgi:glucokinase